MKLSDYLLMHRMTPAAFARQVGVKSRTTIHRYLKGQQFPAPDILSRIEAFTHGEVTARDFQKINTANDNTSDFPWSRQDRREIQECEMGFRRMLRGKPEGDDLSPPLKRAVYILGDRVQVDKAKRNFRLDGRTADARDLVRVANRCLELHGCEPISYPGVYPK